MTLICGIVCGSYSAWAQDLPKPGKVYKEVRCDLNRDGKVERIGLVAHSPHKESDSFWGRLTVWDSSGKQLWQAPIVKDQRSAFAFGSWPFGASTIDWVGDLDNDQQIDLISAQPQSDVRPPTYNRYRWDGKQFQALPAMMLLESPEGSGSFLWTKASQWGGGEKPLTWIMSISGSPSNAVAGITSYRGGGNYADGQASLRGDVKGVAVKKWIKKVAPSGQ